MGDKTEIIFEPSPSEETFSGQDFSYAIMAVGETPYAQTAGPFKWCGNIDWYGWPYSSFSCSACTYDQVTIVVVAVPEGFPLDVTLM
ncbi:PREDICTED: uncharacterized protein LOC109148708 isoform X2 [Ipomoea nil]|nr:PREDICTED: uncharacterized protein LOC109148708 isoform X2 [Ipomoea nil]